VDQILAYYQDRYGADSRILRLDKQFSSLEAAKQRNSREQLMGEIQALRGTRDILPAEVGYWQWVEAVARQI